MKKIMRPWVLFAAFITATTCAASATAAAPEDKLKVLGLTLPAVSPSVANYVPAVRAGNLLFLSGHLPRRADGKFMTGTVANDDDVALACEAARQITLSMLATIKAELGELSKVRRIVRVGAFVNSADTFTRQPQIANACSDLLVAVFGERGRHARAAIGVNTLPLGVIVEIDMIVEIE
jgi:enamine deaminase RidA (YjgF/YER057c/UK114 family)